MSSLPNVADSRPERRSAKAIMAERTERRLAARERLRVQKHRLIHARRADEAMPMAVYYGPRPLWAVPMTELLGRRVA